MEKLAPAHWFLIAFSFLAGASAWAQNAPGEDPITLSKRVSAPLAPTAGSRPSSPLNLQTDMPAWMKAKVARYEAKSNADQTRGMLTDSDIVRSASSDGFKKTCIQEVGSNAAAGTAQNGVKPGFGNNQQIVVLKGDLVNICK